MKLRRDTSMGWFGGVCAGLAELFGIDVRVVRTIAVLGLFTGFGAMLYVALWLIVPDEHGRVPITSGRAGRGRRAT